MAPVDEKESKQEEEENPIVKELKVIDDKYLEVEREYERECNELVKKYTAKQKPFLEERRRLLTQAESSAAAYGTPALGGFWLKAMQHHPVVEEYIQKWDEAVLEYLVDIEKDNLEGEDDPNKGFKLTFHFSENPYFTNSELCKEYHTEETNPYNGELDTKKIVATAISWKAGQNVTVERIAKKVKGGGSKKQKAKNKGKEEPRPSFFRNFIRSLDPDMKLTEDMMEEGRQLFEGDDDDEDEDTDDIIEGLMENDYQVGCVFRDTIVPFAVRWYTGEAAPDQGEDSDDDYEEDEEEDDDEEEEEEDEPAPKAKAKKAAGKKKATQVTPKSSPDMKPSGEPKQEECKQQ